MKKESRLHPRLLQLQMMNNMLRLMRKRMLKSWNWPKGLLLQARFQKPSDSQRIKFSKSTEVWVISDNLSPTPPNMKSWQRTKNSWSSSWTLSQTSYCKQWRSCLLTKPTSATKARFSAQSLITISIKPKSDLFSYIFKNILFYVNAKAFVNISSVSTNS